MPRFAALDLDRSGEELFDVGLFTGERVEDSVDAVELKFARCLVGKRDGEVVHGMFKHVSAVNANILGFQSENVIWRWCEGAWWQKNCWLLHMWHGLVIVKPRKLRTG